VCRNLLFEILCVHIIGFEDSWQKKNRNAETKQGETERRLPSFGRSPQDAQVPCFLSCVFFSFAPHTLAHLLHFVSSSFDYVFGTIIQPCNIV
jgi:hypothetical protein